MKISVQSARLILNNHWNEWKNQPIFNPIRENQQKTKFFNAQLTQIADHYFVSINEWEMSFVVHLSFHPYAPSAWQAVNLWRK
jgi:hypothetical protein